MSRSTQGAEYMQRGIYHYGVATAILQGARVRAAVTMLSRSSAIMAMIAFATCSCLLPTHIVRTFGLYWTLLET